LVAVPADEAKVVVIKEHAADEEHGVKPKKKKAKKLKPDKASDEEDRKTRKLIQSFKDEKH